MQNSEPAETRLWPAVVLAAFVAALVLVPPSVVERLPSVCLNRLLFGWCPGCGSLRALVRLFHGDPAGAVRLNVNVLLTAPLLILLLLDRLRRGRATSRIRY